MKTCFCTLVARVTAMPLAALALVAASLVSLLAAFTAQYGFDVQPCILCLFQRVPYALALVLGCLALALRARPQAVKVLFALMAATFFTNVGIAFFHSGVELHWWAGTDSCAVMPLNGELSADQLLTLAVAQCDEIKLQIFGLTLANLNVLFCAALGVFALVAGFGQAWLGRVFGAAREKNCCCCGCGKKAD